MDIVAKKMGELRGGIFYDAKPDIVVVQDQMATGSIGIDSAGLSIPAAPEGQARAVERTVSGSSPSDCLRLDRAFANEGP